jgi:hypothetical protein
MPPSYQMLDDILTLRSIEETVELLCFQFGSPLLHAKVGTPAEPSNETEVDRVNSQIVAMAPNGMITTDHRVEIDVINIQKAVANLIPFIDHFKSRVIIGAGASQVSIGEGDSSNRSTAESIDDALADHCTYIGSCVCSIFNNDIIPDILMSLGLKETDIFDDNGEVLVKMSVNEPRINKKIAQENAVINKWNCNLITLPEARRMLNNKPLSAGEEKDLQVNKVTIPVAQAKGIGGMGGEGGGAAHTKTQAQPKNQYGTKAGPGSTQN